MNFLAHAVLGEAGGCNAALSLLGDFVRGRPETRYAGPALAAIRLHRQLDRYVDAHPGHTAARSRLAGPWRRYAGVLVDVYFDHLLARAFARHTGLDLPAYAQRLYAQLHAHAPALPDALNRFAARAAAHDLFVGYGQPHTVGQVLGGIGQRLRRPVPLEQALPALTAADAGLAQDFAALWPDALDAARRVGAGEAVACA